MSENAIKDQSKAFAIRIVRLYHYLREEKNEWVLSKQILRSGTSIGAMKSGDKSAYRYLPQSIAAVPQGDDMLQLMRNAGLCKTAFRRLTLGVCTIYTAVK